VDFVLVITWSEKCDYLVLPSKVVVLLSCVVVDEAKKEFGAASYLWWKLHVAEKESASGRKKNVAMSLSPSGIDQRRVVEGGLKLDASRW
jgi:hypothetical protein